MPLTALKVRTAGPGRHADIHGLYLNVRPTGSRSWVLRMQFKGKRRDFGLGPVHDVSLADPRLAAAELRKMVRAGLDPVKERNLKRHLAPSFEIVARRCHEAMKGGWKNGFHNAWLPSLENHVFPIVGRMPIDKVDSTAVLRVLEPIWLSIPHSARRILQRIGTVLDYAHINGLMPNEVTLRSVTRGLPRQAHKVSHREAMPFAKVPAFMASVYAQENSAGRDALKPTVLTAVRSNETRFATWGEFDLDAGIWTIPARRMKAKEEHVVPLAEPVLELVRRLRREALALHGDANSERLVFSWSGAKLLSDVTMVTVMRDMGIAKATVHGFRSTFADWAAECTDFPKEVADKALAHKVPNAVEAAYRRTVFFEKRRTLMREWAAFALSEISKPARNSLPGARANVCFGREADAA